MGKDDDDIATTAILTNDNGNANSINGSVVKANVPATKTDTAIINNGNFAKVNANANFNNDGKSTVNANDNPSATAIYTGDNPTDIGSSTDNQSDSGNIKISTVVPADNNSNTNSIKGSAVDANTTATNIKDKESECQRKCYCCFDEQITKFNLEHGFVKNAPAIFNASTGAFPGYLPLHTVSTDTKAKKARGLFIEEVTKHSNFVYEVAEYFQFITDTTRTILCSQHMDHSFKLAFAKRFAILIVLVKRYTSSIQDTDKSTIVKETSEAKGVVDKGITHLSSLVKRIEDSSKHKWSDYYGSLSKDDATKCCFGIFIFIEY